MSSYCFQLARSRSFTRLVPVLARRLGLSVGIGQSVGAGPARGGGGRRHVAMPVAPLSTSGAARAGAFQSRGCPGAVVSVLRVKRFSGGQGQDMGRRWRPRGATGSGGVRLHYQLASPPPAPVCPAWRALASLGKTHAAPHCAAPPTAPLATIPALYWKVGLPAGPPSSAMRRAKSASTTRSVGKASGSGGASGANQPMRSRSSPALGCPPAMRP